mgnify:CR=1 FL=1
MEFEEVENIGQRIKEIAQATADADSIYHDPEAVPVYRSVSGISEQSGAEPGKPDAEQSAAHLSGAWYFDPGSAQTFRRGKNPDPPGGAAVI